MNELFKLVPNLIDVINDTQDTPKLQALYRQVSEHLNNQFFPYAQAGVIVTVWSKRRTEL